MAFLSVEFRQPTQSADKVLFDPPEVVFGLGIGKAKNSACVGATKYMRDTILVAIDGYHFCKPCRSFVPQPPGVFVDWCLRKSTSGGLTCECAITYDAKISRLSAKPKPDIRANDKWHIALYLFSEFATYPLRAWICKPPRRVATLILRNSPAGAIASGRFGL